MTPNMQNKDRQTTAHFIGKYCSARDAALRFIENSTGIFLRSGRLLGVGSILALNVGVFSSLAHADTLIFTSEAQTCTGVNCGSTFLNGFSHKDAIGESVPFTLQVHGSAANDCIRVDVVNQSDDMKIVLISPSGRVWSNDDRAPDEGDLRPLVTAQADVDGFYTIQINRFDGGQPINSLQTFTVAYGRYSLNPRNQDNCSSLVFPAMTASLKEK